jgi:transcriptional antiterminator RfaH
MSERCQMADATAGATAPRLASGERWYVVQSQPRKEFVAAHNLENQNFRTFLPRLKKTVRHARRTQIVYAPLFPRYLFVVLDLDRDRWRSVLGTLGVSQIIIDSGRPKPVPIGVVEVLGKAVGHDMAANFSELITVGADVRFLSGPLAEQIGRVVRLDEKGRVAVLMELLGAERVVSATASSLLPVGR